MIRDITIGQYYTKDSIIHRLDARTKIFGTFILITVPQNRPSLPLKREPTPKPSLNRAKRCFSKTAHGRMAHVNITTKQSSA